MKCQMIWCVIQANVLEVMVAHFACVLEHGRLENWHANRSKDPRNWFACVDELRINMLESFDQLYSSVLVDGIVPHNCSGSVFQWTVLVRSDSSTPPCDTVLTFRNLNPS